MPAGTPDGGQWTDADGGWGDGQAQAAAARAAKPGIDDPRILSDADPATDWKPGEQYAARKPPEIGHNGGPPLDEPPNIPDKLPSTATKRMDFVRKSVEWLGNVLRRTKDVRGALVIAEAFLEHADRIPGMGYLVDMIRTANDPAETRAVLQGRVSKVSQRGYEDHHIVDQHPGNRLRFGDERIDSVDNQVRISKYKHLRLNRWYSTPNEKFGMLSPRDHLRNREWDEQMEVGLDALRAVGALK